MINVEQATKYSRDAISMIENYDKAINDQTQTWICHHRLGLTLDGEFAHSKDELKRLGMYLDRPYFELQFLPPSEHRRLHNMHMSDETRKKMSEAQTLRYKDPEQRKKISESNKGKPAPNKGLPMSAEQKQKISEAKKGKPFSDEHRRKLSESQKGKHSKPHKPHKPHKQASDETKRKISEARKAYWARRKANAV